MGGLTNFFIFGYYWILLLNFLLIVILGLFIFFKSRHKFKRVDILLLLFFAIILFLAVSLRFHNFAVNDTLESLSNEYKISAKNFYLYHIYGNCYRGTVSNCMQDLSLPRHTHAHPFLISLFFILTGVNENGIILYNIIMGILSVIMLFFLSFTYFKNKRSALTASLILSVFPMFIVWGTRSEVVITNIFFIGLSLILIKLSYDKDSIWIYLLTFLTILFTANVRAENIALLLVFLIFLIVKRKRMAIFRKINLIQSVVLIVSGLIFIFDILIVRFASTQQGNKLINLSPAYLTAQFSLIFEVFMQQKILIFPLIGVLLLLFNLKSLKSALPLIIYVAVQLFLVASFQQVFSLENLRYGMGNLQRYATPSMMVILALGTQGFFSVVEYMFNHARSLYNDKNKAVASSLKILQLIIFISVFIYFLSFVKIDMQGVEPVRFNESGALFSQTLDEIKPDFLAVGSLELLEYSQFISDDIPVAIDTRKDKEMVSDKPTGVYFIEIVSSHFPEQKDNPYFISMNVTPYLIRGDFYVYNYKKNAIN